MAAWSCRWYSNRDAVSRCQPLGCSSSATSSAVVALLSRAHLRLVSLRHDPPDPSAIDPAGGVHVLEDPRRQEGGSFDQLAAHVDDPEAAVRPVGHLHRAEPVVARGEELAALLGALGHHPHAVRHGEGTMDEVVGHVADEQVAPELGRKGVATVNRHAGAAGEEARRRAPLVGAGDDPLAPQSRPQRPPRLDRADAVQLREFAAPVRC